MIDVSDGFTSIEVTPDVVPYLNVNWLALTTPPDRSSERHGPTGARVTVEFARPAPVPTDAEVRVYYDIAENGGLREMRGTPQLTHITSHPGDRAPYHYRLSHWIPALSIMRFIPPHRLASAARIRGPTEEPSYALAEGSA